MDNQETENTTTDNNNATQTQTHEEESKPKLGFMMGAKEVSSPEIANQSPDFAGEPAKSPEELTKRELLGDVPLAELASRMQDEDFMKEVNSAPSGEEEGGDDKEEKEEKSDEVAKPELKVAREIPREAQETTETPATTATTPVTAETTTATDPDKEFIDALDEEAKHVLDWYEQAEGVDPEKFKGARQKHLDYLKNLDAKVQEIKKNDPEADLEESYELQQFVKDNKPSYSKVDIESAKEEILVQKAHARAKKDYDRELHQIKAQPVVEKMSNEFASETLGLVSKSKTPIIEDVTKVINEEGFEAAQQQYPEESKAIMDSYNSSRDLADAFIGLRNNTVQYDENNPLHVMAGNKVIEYGQQMMSEDNAKHRVNKDGKQFMEPSKYYALTESQRSQHWTFSTDQILKFMQEDARQGSEKAVDQVQVRKYNYLEKVAKSRNIPIDDLVTDKDKPVSMISSDDARDEAAESTSVTSSRASGSTVAEDTEHKGSSSFMLHGLSRSKS